MATKLTKLTITNNGDNNDNGNNNNNYDNANDNYNHAYDNDWKKNNLVDINKSQYRPRSAKKHVETLKVKRRNGQTVGQTLLST